MAYVDGFVLVVKKKNLPRYWKIAKAASRIWKEYGAVEYRECMGDDMKCAWGVAFPKMAKAKAGETVVFSWITYKNKAHRDAVNKKVMQDKRLMEMCDPQNSPFDVKRMAYGGFKVMVSEK